MRCVQQKLYLEEQPGGVKASRAQELGVEVSFVVITEVIKHPLRTNQVRIPTPAYLKDW
jgi:hypothetical protein